jgi:hypothetical protein
MAGQRMAARKKLAWPGGEWPRANIWHGRAANGRAQIIGMAGRRMAANWEDESALMEHHLRKEELEEELTSSRNWTGIVSFSLI